MIDKASAESQEKSGWVLRKPCAPAFDSKTRRLCPSESKPARFQAPLSSPSERNHARSAFKRFFPPKILRKVWVLISLRQSLRVFDALSLIYRISLFH